MKCRIIYHSVTGNTRKIAREIAAELGCPAEEASHASSPVEADLLYIGGACYGGKLDPKLAACIESLETHLVGRAVLFTTGFPKTSAVKLMQDLLNSRGIPVHEESLKVRGRFLLFNWSRPNAQDKQDARNFARRSLSEAQDS